jgi:Zn finger protein HypA/HybF involved in hydrogenase expression
MAWRGVAAAVPEQFLFRCRACGRVAPETSWTVLGPAGAIWSDALNLRRYPKVRCPACESRDIDLNHGLQVEARPTFRLHDPPREPPKREN